MIGLGHVSAAYIPVSGFPLSEDDVAGGGWQPRVADINSVLDSVLYTVIDSVIHS